MVQEKWNEIKARSKIVLERDMKMMGFNDEWRDLKAGTYYINGFWLDMCGLATTLEKNRQCDNDVCIKSTELVHFKDII